MQPSIETYRIIVEQAVDPIFVTDNEGCILYANTAAEYTFGYRAAEYCGRNLHNLIHFQHPDGTPYPREECPNYQSHRDGQVLHDRVDSYVRKDGSRITMAGTTAPLDLDGQRIGHAFFMRDVSARVMAEQALHDSEQRFRLITESMPQIVWTATPDGAVDFVNSRFREYTGLQGKVGAEYQSPIHPEDQDKRDAALSSALREGVEYRLEHRVRAADGSYRWFLTHGIPLKDAQGKVLGWYGSSVDIDELRRTADELRKSRETLRLATEVGDIGLWDFYPPTGELVWSDTNKRLHGFAPGQKMTIELFREHIHPADLPRVDASVQQAIQRDGDTRFDIEYRAYRADDGMLRWFKGKGQVLKDTDDQSIRMIGTTLDITDTKVAEQRARDASQRDALTGLPNRALLTEYCNRLLAIAERTKSSGALLFIDLDRFKPINDTHGHDVGDQVLKQVAQRLLACTRKEDVVGRLGGDEFVVAVPHPDDTHGPATVAHNIIEAISAPYHVGDLQLHLSTSIGISMFPRHGKDLDTLLKNADTAMYAAKKAGRKHYSFYTSELEDGVLRPEEAIEERLKDALANNTLALHYQPVMDMHSGRAVAAEALLRLPQPDLPDSIPLTPEQFLPVAEAAGLLNQVGAWVAQEACRQHQEWRAAGLPPLGIAINVAPQQFRQRSFVAQLAESVRRYGMDPSCLQIELRESAVMDDVQDTIAALEEIRSLGISVALDDFGIGYASVGQLSSLPLDKLKIDQSFINALSNDPHSRTVADSILALGHSLNLKVVGEGIESEEAFDYLRDHGCDQAQGYYVSKPLEADEFAQWYMEHHTPRHALH